MSDLIRVGASQLQSRSYLLQSTHANTDDHKLLSSFPVGGNALYLHLEGLVLAFVPEVLHVLVLELLSSFLRTGDMWQPKVKGLSGGYLIVAT